MKFLCHIWHNWGEWQPSPLTTPAYNLFIRVCKRKGCDEEDHGATRKELKEFK